MNNNRSGPGPVPDRWLHCPRKSTTVIAGKFLAFKTLLDSRYDDQVPEECRFTPNMLFESTKSYKHRIGLWIDLTNTSRFYDKDEIIEGYGDGNVAYSKIPCKGHAEAPSEDQARLFISLCDTFISKYPLKIVGVHCTHGFNRTGFLIVSYLVDTLNWSLEAALMEFAKARPPGIYKDQYIQELYRIYGDGDPVPPAAPRPDWCFTGNNTPYQSNKMEKRSVPEHTQKDNGPRKHHKSGEKVPEFMEGITGVRPVMDLALLRELQQTAKKFCKFQRKGFPGAQPVSMDFKNLKFLQNKAYTVSWKADGTRYMMLIMGENKVFCIDRDNNFFQVSGLRFVQRKNLDAHIDNALLDGEMVIDKHEGKCFPRFLVYDIIRVNNIDVSELAFYPQRLQCIEADIIIPRYQAIMAGKINKEMEPFSIRAKVFYPVEKAKSFLSEKFSKQLSHEPDGLIFQPSDDPYKAGQCLEVLKWKPASHNSVDFRLKVVTESGEGIVTRKVGHLYVGNYDRPFSMIKYTHVVKDLDNKIIECRFENNNWVFMRERTDKSFPNSYQTAMAVCNSIKHPVTKEYLLHFIEHFRFRTDDDMMPPPSSCHRR